MHADFAFTPAKTASRYTQAPLLKPAKTVGAALAGDALRTYAAIAAHGKDILPGLAAGVIHLPRDMLLTHNNYQGGKTEPSPVQVVQAESDPDMGLVWCLFFTDRTALICVEDRKTPTKIEGPVMGVLPIVLRLSSEVKLRHNHKKYRFSIEASGKRAHLMLKPLSWTGDKFFFFEAFTGHLRHDMAALQAGFNEDILSWAREAKHMPWIHDPGPGPAEGIFGKDAPAPAPDLEGTPYAWPAAMPHSNFTAEQFREAEKIFHLAFVHLVARHEAEISDMAVAILAGGRRQDGEPGRATIVLRITSPHPHEKTAELERKLAAEYRALLQHPKAPGFLLRMEGQGIMVANEGGTRSKLKSYKLYVGHMSEARSRHDRIAAHAFFET